MVHIVFYELSSLKIILFIGTFLTNAYMLKENPFLSIQPYIFPSQFHSTTPSQPPTIHGCFIGRNSSFLLLL